MSLTVRRFLPAVISIVILLGSITSFAQAPPIAATKFAPQDGDYIAEREIKRVPKGKFVLIPASDQTHGHGTHTWAVFWQQYLQELLEESK